MWFCVGVSQVVVIMGVAGLRIAAAFLTQTVNLDDTTVKFEIWDTAGQERYHSLAPMYYRGAQAAIVVYDITNMVSLLSCIGRGNTMVCSIWGCCCCLGHVCAGKTVGQGTSAASQSQHRDRSLGK